MKKNLLAGAILLLFYSVQAQQWTTAGNDIYNTNSGIVVIKPTGATGGEKFVINPMGPGNMTIGEANTGVGGYTSLSLGISAYQNGYSWIESITASGSAYGNLIINPSGGNVGIGTNAPGSFKLAVEGKIGAREIKVTAQSPWPDYVFSPTYKLKPLFSLEDYIKKNNHLPSMPSAQEVKSDGIELGQMNGKLLEKIEELTLYVIKLNRKIDKQQKEIDHLKAGRNPKKQ